MVDVLVIPDGAAQPPRPREPTAFEMAAVPTLDRLAREGTVMRVRTTPTGLPPGSETGIAVLLGVTPAEPIGRGWVDAAAYEVDVPEGRTPWRADLVYRNGRRASIRQARDASVHLGPMAHAITGHRLLLVAESQPADRALLGLQVRVWPQGARPAGAVPMPTTVVSARGAAAGLARQFGAELVIPEGATGDVDTNLAAKAAAAVRAIEHGRTRIVVHVGAVDEAAHRRDQAAAVAALERIDAELLAPLTDAVGERGGRLAVCPDHGTDPLSRRHDAAPVPAVVWGAGIEAWGPETLSERVVSLLPVNEAGELFPAAVATP